MSPSAKKIFEFIYRTCFGLKSKSIKYWNSFIELIFGLFLKRVKTVRLLFLFIFVPYIIFIITITVPHKNEDRNMRTV